MQAIAHLGGKGGLKRFIETGGKYNPADANGTRLSDYGARHGGSPSQQAGSPSQGLGQRQSPVTPQMQQYAGIYQKYAMEAAKNPALAERMGPMLGIIKSKAMSEMMANFQGDLSTPEGAMAMSYQVGRMMPLFGETVDPTAFFELATKNAEHKMKQRTGLADIRSSDARANYYNRDQVVNSAKSAATMLQMGAFDKFAGIMGDTFGVQIGGFKQVEDQDGDGQADIVFDVQTPDGESVQYTANQYLRQIGAFETQEAVGAEAATSAAKINMPELQREARIRAQQTAGWERMTPEQQLMLEQQYFTQLRAQIESAERNGTAQGMGAASAGAASYEDIGNEVIHRISGG